MLTYLPVVEYNQAEIIGIKIYTIPIEDIFYGMLLVLLNILLFEKFRNKNWLPKYWKIQFIKRNLLFTKRQLP